MCVGTYCRIARITGSPRMTSPHRSRASSRSVGRSVGHVTGTRREDDDATVHNVFHDDTTRGGEDRVRLPSVPVLPTTPVRETSASSLGICVRTYTRGADISRNFFTIRETAVK